MKTVIRQIAVRFPLRKTAILGLMLIVALAVSADFLSGIHDRICEDMCDDSCEDCSDCVTCSPILHMLPDNGPDLSYWDHIYGWHFHLPPSQSFNILSSGIDHPPRRLS
ncbi:MAG: hypothetical protein AB1746_02620 [Candidatus Zixiibacteriota bacterium]